ncbi:DUF2061 domain-containing protein [Halovulum sp. GXIMD14793]
METSKRTLCKAITWQVMGLVMMTVLGYLLTGSIQTGGSLAILGALVGFVTYVLHERVWSRIGWGVTSLKSGEHSDKN